MPYRVRAYKVESRISSFHATQSFYGEPIAVYSLPRKSSGLSQETKEELASSWSRKSSWGVCFPPQVADKLVWQLEHEPDRKANSLLTTLEGTIPILEEKRNRAVESNESNKRPKECANRTLKPADVKCDSLITSNQSVGYIRQEADSGVNDNLLAPRRAWSEERMLQSAATGKRELPVFPRGYSFDVHESTPQKPLLAYIAEREITSWSEQRDDVEDNCRENGMQWGIEQQESRDSYGTPDRLECVSVSERSAPPGITESKSLKIGKKKVHFAQPLIASLNFRPKTEPEEMKDLYFDEGELEELEADRENTPRDQFEMIAQELSKNRMRISIAYQNGRRESAAEQESPYCLEVFSSESEISIDSSQ